MTDVDGTCEYLLDPDDPETWGGEEGDKCYVDEEVLNEDGIWTCPHDAEDDGSLCIFHLPPEEKDDTKVVEALWETIEAATDSTNYKVQERARQFLGARFSTFDLSEAPPQIKADDRGFPHPKIESEEGGIDFSYAKIEGVFDWSSSTFDMAYLRLIGVKFIGDTDFRGVKFKGDTDFSHAEFRGTADFENGEFDGASDFKNAVFKATTNFENAEFKHAANFRNVKFSGSNDFEETEFRSTADFGFVEFRMDPHFIRAEFKQPAQFSFAEFRGTATFWHTIFRNDASFSDVKFRGVTDFMSAEFRGTTNFKDVEFGDNVKFRDSRLESSFFEGIDLTDAEFNDSNLRDSNLESALLSRATIFGADLRGARLAGTVLGDIRIDEDTKFLGHSSDDRETSPHTFSSILSKPCCVYDPEYEDDNEHTDIDKAKSVYRALEELGGKHALPRLQARSFVRRQDLQKKDYWDDAIADDASLEERFIAGARWSRAKAARATLLYGESPWRVISWSLGIILSFALLYPLGGWMKPTDGDPITYAQIESNPVEILNSVYYSTLTYTALGFGDFQPVGLGRLLTTLETGLGAVMLALLVFILGRRAAR